MQFGVYQWKHVSPPTPTIIIKLEEVDWHLGRHAQLLHLRVLLILAIQVICLKRTRLSVSGLCTETLAAEGRKLLESIGPKIASDTLRNLMDMKANLGSFGAALKKKDVWVMNVVPEKGPNTLKLIEA